MIPIAGIAYTYGYATMGEIVAWIIGWALVLEYAFGAATVALGWSGYLSEPGGGVRVYVSPRWRLPGWNWLYCHGPLDNRYYSLCGHPIAARGDSTCLLCRHRGDHDCSGAWRQGVGQLNSSAM